VTRGTFELVLEVEERIFIDGLYLDRPGLVAAECGTTDQESDGDEAEDDQDSVAVELHLLVCNIFLIKCVKDTGLVSS